MKPGQADILLETGKILASCGDLNKFLRSIFELVVRSFKNVDAFYIGIIDPVSPDQIDFLIWSDIDEKGKRVFGEDKDKPLVDRIHAQVIKEGRPCLISRTEEEMADKKREFEQNPEKQDWIGRPVPSASLMFALLMIADRTIGVMSVQSYSFKAYTEEDLDLLNALATYVAGGIEAARLHDASLRLQYLPNHGPLIPLIVAGRDLGAFAHDLKNTFSRINADFSTLLNWIPKQTKNREEVSVFIKTLAVDLSFVAECLDRFKKYREFAKPKIKRHDINAIIKKAIKTLHLRLREAKIVLQFRPCENLTYIDCDAFQMEQVFVNLILNSIQAMKSVHRLEKRIRIKTRSNGNYLRITIEDKGSGINPEDLEKIWEPFFSCTDGTGFGLYIVKNVVEIHDGEIKVFPGYGKGATFAITLPINQS